MATGHTDTAIRATDIHTPAMVIDPMAIDLTGITTITTATITSMTKIEPIRSKSGLQERCGGTSIVQRFAGS